MTPSAKTYTLDLTQSLAPTPGQPEKKPMHIPVRIGLVGAKGAALPLTLEGENHAGADNAGAGADGEFPPLHLRGCGGGTASVAGPRFLRPRHLPHPAQPA